LNLHSVDMGNFSAGIGGLVPFIVRAPRQADYGAANPMPRDRGDSHSNSEAALLVDGF
jgi:hypothetical protein